MPTTAGSKILDGYRPPYTAAAVRRLAAAGAGVLGKTNMDEFAMGSSNENSAYGPVLNPWDRGRVPGGSSGGSAAVVAAGLAPCSIGTDTGGSIRQPASLCGIVGLKPTYGAISRYGMIAFASSLDQCGPLTRDVTDAALLLAAMEGRDPCDSTSVGIEGGIVAPSREDLAGLRFGVPRELGGDGIDAGVRAVFEATLKRIEGLGGEIVEVGLPNSEHGISAYYVIAPAEASSNLARYDGVRYGVRSGGDGDLLEMYETTRSEGFGDEVKRRIMLGTYALSSGYYDAYYGQAQKVRTRIAEDFDTAFADGRLRRHPDLALGRLRARREDRRPALDVPQRLLHGADEPGRDPGDLDAGGAGRAGGRRRRAAGRLPDRRSGLRRAEAAGGELRARAGDRVRGQAGGRRWLSCEAVIGLEIHVQLATKTKMFCGCELSFGDEPNTHTCPICLAHPGVLPVPNEQAILYALQIAAGAGVRGRAALDLPPQELLLSRQPEGLPDQPVRHSAGQQRKAGRRSASTAPTSRRTRRRRSTSASRAASTAPTPRWSTSTAAARRWSRSSPSPTCAAPPKRPSGRGCCARRCASSASLT